MIFPVTDDRVADCRKLRADLILQSSHQRHPDKSGAGKKPLDGISKFGPSGFGVSLCPQVLKHPYASEIVNQSPLFGVQAPAKNHQILPVWLMPEKLSNEHISIGLGLGEEQNAGRETVDAMDNQGSLPPRRKSLGKQRQSGRTVGAFDGHSRQARRFVDGHYGIVLVKHGKLPREAR